MTGRSFFTKLFLGNLALVVVILLLGVWVANHHLDASYHSLQRQEQRRVTAFAAGWLGAVWDEVRDRPGELDRFCKRLARRSLGDLRLTVILPDGTVGGDSSPMPAERMRPHDTPDRPEVMAALEGREGWGRRTSETLGREFRYHAVPLELDGERVAVVRVAMPVRALGESSDFLSRSLWFGAGAAAAGAVMLALLLSWLWYSPLRELTGAARSLASGNLDQRVRVGGSRELRQLSDALNEMAEGLARQMAAAMEREANLQTVVTNLREGVVATDAEYRVILINRAAEEILDAYGCDGRHVQSVVRLPDVLDACERVRQTGRGEGLRTDTLHDGRRMHLEVSVSPVAEEDRPIGMLIVLRDVTDIIETAEMKARFITNASHELRTPVATLRAAVDALEDARVESDSAGDVLTMLDRQVARLQHLTTDMLHFSEVAEVQPVSAAEEVRLGELAEWVRSRFAAEAERRGIALSLRVDDDAPPLTTNRRLVDLILQNLLDNALKRTAAGGRVLLAMSLADGEATLSVADTGEGIPDEEQPRVFDYFYQVDPSRTGDVRHRGSGLGLAVVRHAADRLGGTVELESKVGEGTTVTVRLPA